MLGPKSRISFCLSTIAICWMTATASAFSVCDFDGSDACTVTDLEQLQAAIGSDNLTFDLDTNGLVDNNDISMWLSFASDDDPAGRVFRRGDTNLDGAVTGTDLTPLILNFGRQGTWSDGNFDADSIVGGSDFTILAYQFTEDSKLPTSSASVVPEPGLSVVFGFILSLAMFRRFVR